MRKYTLFISCLVLSLFLCCCDKDDDPSSSSKAEYYVKYEGTVSAIVNGKATYTVNTETGKQTFESGKSFSQTFGPVKKGFTASISIDASNI